MRLSWYRSGRELRPVPRHASTASRRRAGNDRARSISRPPARHEWGRGPGREAPGPIDIHGVEVRRAMAESDLPEPSEGLAAGFQALWESSASPPDVVSFLASHPDCGAM